MQALTLDFYPLHSLTTSLDCKVKTLTGIGFPDVRIDSYSRAGTHGQTVAHNLYGGRIITLEGTIRGATPTLYMANRLELEEAVGLLLDANNVPVARTLHITDMNFSDYRVGVVTKSFVCDFQSPTYARWQLQLIATDYTIESAATYSTSITLPISGGTDVPFYPFPISFGGASGGSGVAANAGNTASYPTILISGPCINPRITNESTGEYLAINLTLVSGDLVTANMKSRTVTQGGSTNRMGAVATGSTFFSLLPGNNNLRFTADSFDTGTATVTWSSQFLGI